MKWAPKTGPQAKVYSGAIYRACGGAERWSKNVACVNCVETPFLILWSGGLGQQCSVVKPPWLPIAFFP